MPTDQDTNTVKPDHTLKSWPTGFQDIWDGKLSYQWRKNDRQYGVGDVLLLREWRPTNTPEPDKEPQGIYTGRSILARVVHMTSGAFKMPTDFCVLGIVVYNRQS